uniref:Protein kinase domain-containing protein n=1 Tax=Anser cygnoides TaxID=8845 RepID=A0A8B9D3W2_ANSCY
FLRSRTGSPAAAKPGYWVRGALVGDGGLQEVRVGRKWQSCPVLMSVCPQVFTALSSKLLISIYECAETRMRFCLCMELAPLGSILARWQSQGSCSECQVGLWFSQLVLCLGYLHSRAIVHRWVTVSSCSPSPSPSPSPSLFPFIESLRLDKTFKITKSSST